MKYLLLIALFSATEPDLVTEGQIQAPACVAFCAETQTLKTDVDDVEEVYDNGQCEAEQN